MYIESSELWDLLPQESMAVNSIGRLKKELNKFTDNI